MGNYKIITEYTFSKAIEFEECHHVQNIKNEHFHSGEFVCNKCSYIHNYNNLYDFDKGLIDKSEIIRKCKCCKEEDKLSNLVAVKKNTKSGVRFWFYHESCLTKYEHDLESVELLINDDTVKSKDITKSNKSSTKRKVNFAKKSSKDVMNIGKIIFNQGESVITSLPITVINRTYYDVQDMKNICGIYSIRNIINNKRYIGSSTDINHRFKAHCRDLVKNEHTSYKLQNDYNLLGNNKFRFEILEILDNDVNKKLLEMTEQKYMDLTNSVKEGYNINPVAGFAGSASDYYNLVDKL